MAQPVAFWSLGGLQAWLLIPVPELVLDNEPNSNYFQLWTPTAGVGCWQSHLWL